MHLKRIQTVAHRKDKEREVAKELYLQGSKTQKEIAQLVGVTEKTVGNWVEAGQWELLRAGRMSTPRQVITNMVEIHKQRTEQILAELAAGGTNKYGDELLKMSMAIEKLQGHTSLTTYIGVLSDFMGYIPLNETGLRAQLALYQSKFLNDKATGL